MQIIMEGRASPTKSIIETSANFFAKELGLSRSRFTLLIMTERGMSRKEGMRGAVHKVCLLYTSPSPRDVEESRMPSSA